ncbi:membrane protein [Rhizobiales bacterium GAS191]|nr:membrane protein [Rhizobiales bacterium GAS191]
MPPEVADRPAEAAKESRLWTLILGAALFAVILSPRLSGHPAGRTSRSPEEVAESREPTFAELEASRRRAAEPNRGRRANTPGEIPARGWKDILWRSWDGFNKDRILSVAAGVTFYVLLALFPAVAALVSLYGLFADRSTIGENLNLLSGVLPEGALEIIGDQVSRIAGQKNTLGLAFFGSLAISLWTANAGMKAMFEAMNVVYGEDEKRSFLALNLRSLSFTLAAIAFLLLALAAIVIVPIILNSIGFTTGGGQTLSLLRWPLLFIMVLLVLALLYRYGPSRRNAKWKWITGGSVLAAVLWLSGSLLFSWYVANFGNYNATYGSLGAAVGFMTWIWLSAIIVLLGGELNAEMEHQTAKDTTIGPAKPLGARGAHMADTVGKGQDHRP